MPSSPVCVMTREPGGPGERARERTNVTAPPRSDGFFWADRAQRGRAMSEDPSRSPDGANGVAGRVVPVYAVTGGRTRSAGTDLPMESLVTVTEHAKQAENLRKEYRVILDIAERPVSLVEVG